MNDLFLNGQGFGNVATTLIKCGMRPTGLRPYFDIVNGQWHECMDVPDASGKLARRLVSNANTTLRKDQWKHLDLVVVKTAKERLRAVADLRSAGLTYSVPNGMGKTVLETETESDISGAQVSMDGVSKGENDRPEYNLTNLPLPIIHKDFSFSARQIATAAQSGSPLDTTMVELAARRVAETAEKMLLGTYGTYSFGGGTLYGYTNHPNRITKTMTNPESSTWTPAKAVADVLDMKLKAQQKFHYGPYMLYASLPWDKYLDDDYSSQKGDNTLRERLRKIEGIQDVKTLDYLSASAYVMVLVQMTSDVVREVMGMDITTVQWPSMGGLQVNFKVMAIMVPQLRADHSSNMGLVHATV